MKIAIHHRVNSFSERWIQYCKKEGLDYKIVNAFDSNIIEQVRDCDVFLWHHSHALIKDVLIAKKILFALEHAGIKVFPDFRTGWHFDDKVAQKYLFEALQVPFVPSYVFYEKKIALDWAKQASYPKVFKLKGGAGAANVKLVKHRKEAIRLINRAFEGGFDQFDRIGHLKERFNRFQNGQDTLIGVLKGIARLFIATNFSKLHPPEKGYIYFQEFISNNTYDIRVIVIGNKAFAIKRLVRENDFRASGSGRIFYKPIEINKDCLKLAFEINRKIESSCAAFDFIFDSNRNPLVVEISYGFSVDAYDLCPGYWDSELNWYEEPFIPQEWMVDNLIKSLKE